MFARILNKSTKVFNSQQYTIFSAAAVIGGVYGVSAILGFIRNRLLSGYFGDSPELGVYFAADDIPSLIFSLIVSGSLSAAFIPVFTKYYRRDGKEAWKITSSVLNISLIILLIFGVAVFLSADFIAANILALNSDLTIENLELMASLMRVMMIAQLALIFSSFYTSILQSFNRFIVPALAPVTYNIGIIVFLVLFVGKFGVYAPAYGMIFGSLLHMGIQFPIARKLGFRYSRVLDLRSKGVREMYRLMIPRTIGQTAQKLIVPLYTNLALFISAPSNVILTFAGDIQNLPVRVFGMSIGQAAVPILSKAYDGKDTSRFNTLLIKTIHQVIYFVLPVSILIFVLRVPLVRLAVGARKYSWEATVMTAYTLGFFSISLVAQSLVVILARAFYALCDTKTPVKLSLFSISINAIIGVFLVRRVGLGVWSLGLAYAIGSTLNSLLLFVALTRRIKEFDIAKFLRPVNRIGFASLITGIALYVPLKVMDELVFDTTRTIWLVVLTGTVSIIGFFTYIGLSRLLRIKELDLVISSLGKILPNRGHP